MLMSRLLCENATGDCYMRRCPRCESKDKDLADDLLQICLQNNIETIPFEVWEKSDRTKIERKEDTAEVVVGILMKKVDKLCKHTHEKNQQTKFIKELHENIPLDTCIADCDFSQNMEFYEADEIQSGHWGKSIGACTLFPVMLKYNNGGIIYEKSCCVISDSLKHNAKVRGKDYVFICR